MRDLLLILLFFSLFSCSRNVHVESTLNSTYDDSSSISAKRSAPKEVVPIVVNAIRYSATMNEIIATDTLTNNVLWKKEVYSVVYEESLERDVQEIYIDSLFFRDGSLGIRNEVKQFYFLNLDTQEVTQRN